MTTPLAVSGLRIDYSGHVAVKEATFAVGSGMTVGLLGPNGAGKSSVIHAVVGLVAPQAGEVLVCGATAHSWEAKLALGFAPDDLPTPLSLTGAETIALVSRLRRGALDDDFAWWLAGQFGLSPHLGRPVAEYSHGMRRKLQVVCAVSHHPALLILDEPMRGLDPEASAILHAILEVHTRSGGGVLLATHDLDSADRYCDEVVIMANGEVVGSGTPRDVCANANARTLSDAFLGLSGLADTVARRRSEIITRMDSRQGQEEGHGEQSQTPFVSH